MNSRDLIKSITEDFFAQKKESIVYLSLSSDDMDICREMLSDRTVVIDLADSKNPLAPFLDILQINKPSQSDIEKYSYLLHQNIFSAFFKDGTIVERKEPIVMEEMDFEKIRMKQTILSFIEKYADRSFLVLNCQMIGENALFILKELHSIKLKGKFIFCFDNMDIDNSPSYVKEFLNSIAGSYNYYAINTGDFSSLKHSFCVYDENNSFEVLINKLRAMRVFMDFHQAYNLIKKIDAKNIVDEMEDSQNRLMNFEMGLIAYYYKDTDFATFCLSNVIESEIDDEIDCCALYIMACLASEKNMSTPALRYVNKGIAKAKRICDRKSLAILTMEEYIITEKRDSEFSTDKYFNAISLLDDVGFINNKIRVSLGIPYGVVYDNSLRNAMHVQIEKTMKETKSIENKFGLSTAYHWMGIIMTYEGRKNNAFEWYQKCFSLRKEIGDMLSILKITNGLSFEYFIDSKYKIAYDMLNDCILSLLDSHDYPEIIITLYNYGRTCFYSKNISFAYDIFQCIFNLLNIFEISDLSGNSFMPEFNDIIVYMGLIDFYRGEYNRAKINLYNLSNNNKKIGVIENYLCHYLSACIEINDGNVDIALENFNSFIDEIISKKFNQDHIIIFMCYEFALLLKKNKRYNEAHSIFLKGNAIAVEKGIEHYTNGQTDWSLEEYEKVHIPFTPFKIKLSLLEEKAEKEKLVNQLHRRLRDSKFLNKLVTKHIGKANDVSFINSALQAVFDYTIASAVFLAEKTVENGWNILGNIIRDQIDSPTNEEWESLVKDEKIVRVYTYANDREVILINLSKFEFTGGVIILLQQNMHVSIEERNILNVAAANIQAQLIMLKQNEYLSKISSTDQLSKLNNRRALLEHLSVQSEMIRRYDKKRSVHMRETICFLDLDNFKYYNDTYGHEAGDLLIMCFSRLMNKIYRKVDFVARFGGDEFVVLLPNTDCSEAYRAAERLYEGLEKEEYFIPELHKMFGKDIKVPKEKYLNFSMGICSNEEIDDISDLETIMSRADQALYYSKQHKKGSVTIWKNVPELVSGLESFNNADLGGQARALLLD